MFYKTLAVFTLFSLQTALLFSFDPNLIPEGKLTETTSIPIGQYINNIEFTDNKTLVIQTNNGIDQTNYSIDIASKKRQVLAKKHAFSKPYEQTESFSVMKIGTLCYVFKDKESYTYLQHKTPIFESFITADKKYAVTLSKEKLFILDLQNKRTVIEKNFLKYEAEHVAMSPDNKHIAISSSDHTIRLYQASFSNNYQIKYHGEPLDQMVQSEPSSTSINKPTSTKNTCLKSTPVKQTSLWQTMFNHRWKILGATTCAVAGCLYKWRNHIKTFFKPKICINLFVFSSNPLWRRI